MSLILLQEWTSAQVWSSRDAEGYIQTNAKKLHKKEFYSLAIMSVISA